MALAFQAPFFVLFGVTDILVVFYFMVFFMFLIKEMPKSNYKMFQLYDKDLYYIETRFDITWLLLVIDSLKSTLDFINYIYILSLSN